MPRDVADEVRQLEKRQRVKDVREEASMKAKEAKAREKRAVTWQVERWKDGKLVSVTEEHEVEEEPEEEEPDWDEDEPVRAPLPVPVLATCPAGCMALVARKSTLAFPVHACGHAGMPAGGAEGQAGQGQAGGAGGERRRPGGAARALCGDGAGEQPPLVAAGPDAGRHGARDGADHGVPGLHGHPGRLGHGAALLRAHICRNLNQCMRGSGACPLMQHAVYEPRSWPKRRNRSSMRRLPLL